MSGPVTARLYGDPCNYNVDGVVYFGHWYKEEFYYEKDDRNFTEYVGLIANVVLLEHS